MNTNTPAMALLGLLALSACGEDTTASDTATQRTAEAEATTPATATAEVAAVETLPEPEPEPVDAIIAFRGEDGEMALARESLEMISPVHDADSDRWSVFVQLDEEAATDFYDLTTRTSGEALSVVVDEMIVSAPVLDTPIYGGGFVFPVDDGTVAGKVVAALKGEEVPAPVAVTVAAEEAAPAATDEGDETVAEAAPADE